MKKYNKIVLNIPHSSFNGIISNNGGWKPNANLINQAIKETDWHTDFLFKDVSNKKVTKDEKEVDKIKHMAEIAGFQILSEKLDNENRYCVYTATKA